MKHQRPEINYNAWLQWGVPDICNLNCAYCFGNNPPSEEMEKDAGKQGICSRWEVLSYRVRKLRRIGLRASWRSFRLRRQTAPRRMPPIDIPALLKTLDRTGKIFRIGFTGGGEPFLIPNFIAACQALSQKHVLAFNTNLTTSNVREMAETIAPNRVVHFHASLHIKELERKNLTARFVHNYHLCRDRGFCIFAQEVGHPSLVNEAEEYRRRFSRHGVEISFAPFHGEYEGRQYPESYTDDELEMFRLPHNSARRMFSTQGVPCNAGFNAAVVKSDGSVFCCLDVPVPLGHIYGRIRFRDNLICCPVRNCSCPLYTYDPHLFALAKEEAGEESPIERGRVGAC